MDKISSMVVYCLAGGNKFKLELPSTYINKPIKELKIYILHQREFPVECQIAFVCQNGKIFKVLKDDELVPNLHREGSTSSLHVYMKASAQTTNLVKTRQSDFEEWLKKLKEFHIDPQYRGSASLAAISMAASSLAAVPLAAAPFAAAPLAAATSTAAPSTAAPSAAMSATSSATAAAPMFAVSTTPPVVPTFSSSTPRAAPRRVSTLVDSVSAIPAFTDQHVRPPATVEIPLSAKPPDTAIPPEGAAAKANDPHPVIPQKYGTQSAHCQACYRKGNTSTLPTHYCYSCDYTCQVLCFDCVQEEHQDHEVEAFVMDPPPTSTSQQQQQQPPPPEQQQQQQQQQQPPPQLPQHQPPSPFAYIEEPELRPMGTEKVGWECSTCTLLNTPLVLRCQVCGNARPASYEVPHWAIPKDEGRDNSANLLGEEPKDARWQCTGCTFFNLPYRPSCEVCTTDRPTNFQIPEDYTPTAAELAFLDDATARGVELEQVLEEERREEATARELNRQALLNTDERSVIGNDVAFDCPICFMECEVGEGVTLRECLHVFCRGCLKGHIESSETPEVKCPYVDDDYHCEEVMQEREIKELAPEFYPKLLDKSLQVAESQAEDSFHCKTVNCHGWCTYEAEVNFFECPVCGVKNCLTCQAIHENQDCKEYQDDLKLKAANDVNARKTQEEIQRLLRTGEAMNCPKCQIIIMKKTGCDWIKCSVCKTELCWVTKQARWGPRGAGDTSGGCRCGVNGHPCHPQCGNCH